MDNEDVIGIVEVDDLNVKCIIFKIKENNESKILSTFISPSDGIQNDIIINLTKATSAVRSCISGAEKKANISLKKINVILEQKDFVSTKFSKYKKIDGSKIHRDDIEFLLKEAKKQLILNDNSQSIIHIFNHNYIVDGKSFVEEPIGIYADTLTHEMTFITAPKNNLKNINQVFIDCDLEIERFFSKIFVLGVNLLKDNELQLGSALINLEFEKAGLGIFKNLTLVHSITIPIGINHIIKDISKVCSLDINEAELIRNNFDFSFENNQNVFDENNFLKKKYFMNSKFRKISKNLITDVIKTRLDEILYLFKKQLIKKDLNFLIVCENFDLLNLEKYCTNFFGSNVKYLGKNHLANNNFPSLLGAIQVIKDGWETEAIPEVVEKNIEKIGFFSKFLKND